MSRLYLLSWIVMFFAVFVLAGVLAEEAYDQAAVAAPIRQQEPPIVRQEEPPTIREAEPQQEEELVEEILAKHQALLERHTTILEKMSIIIERQSAEIVALKKLHAGDGD